MVLDRIVVRTIKDNAVEEEKHKKGVGKSCCTEKPRKALMDGKAHNTLNKRQSPLDAPLDDHTELDLIYYTELHTVRDKPY